MYWLVGRWTIVCWTMRALRSSATLASHISYPLDTMTRQPSLLLPFPRPPPSPLLSGVWLGLPSGLRAEKISGMWCAAEQGAGVTEVPSAGGSQV